MVKKIKIINNNFCVITNIYILLFIYDFYHIIINIYQLKIMGILYIKLEEIGKKKYILLIVMIIIKMCYLQ